MRPIHIAVVLSAGALAVAGCGGGSDPAASSSTPTRPAAGGFAGGQNLTKLADALGVSEAKLQAALKSVMPQRGTRPAGGAPPQGSPPAQGTPPAGGPPAGGAPGGGRPTAQLAKKLGISEAKVRKAFAQTLPQGPGS